MAAKAKDMESHWRILLPTTYLSPPDLRGQEHTLKIADIIVDDLPLEGSPEKQRSLLIRFEGASKPWVPSKTALREIEMIYGGLTADWIGREITIYPARKEATGPRKGKPIRNPSTRRNGEGIRVRVRRVADDSQIEDETTEDNATSESQGETA